MQENKSKKSVALFGSVKIMVFAALMCAFSGVLKFLAPTGDTWRISFENFPIIFSGIVLGPYIAAAVGIVSDLLGCLFRGYAVIPMITVAAMAVGFVSGLIFRLFGKNKNIGIVFAVFLAHAIGNVLLKTIVLSMTYGMPFPILLLERTWIYLLTATAETLIVLIIYKNRAIKNGLKRVINNEL